MKRKNWRWMTATMMALTMTTTAAFSQTVLADAVEKPYLSLGADLSSKEKTKVLELLGVDKNDLDDYQVETITNKDEHDYLDNYLSSSIIGTRALSSVLIEKKDDGNGINVTTHNITYCTAGMYENALSTAGVTDADVVVAGPFDITGTAALVGAMKAYEDMTGEDIDETAKDTATNELVVTGELADELGDSDKAEQFIAMLKEYVAKNDISDTSDIQEAIDECADKQGISLTDDQMQQITDLMKKIDSLDLNVDQLKEQAQEIYQKLSDVEIDGKGFFETVKSWLQSILDIFG